MWDKLPALICFLVGAAIFIVSLVLNRKLRRLTDADRAGSASDPDRPAGESDECRRLRGIILAMDSAALIIIAVGFFI